MSAHPNSPPTEPPPSAIVSHLHHIGHVVRDIDAAIRLYRRMGFVVPPPSFPALGPRSGERPRAFGVGNTHVTFGHSFVELVTVADDRHGGPALRRPSYRCRPLQQSWTGSQKTLSKLRIAYRRHSRDSRVCTFSSLVQPTLTPRWRGSRPLESLPVA
jgi:catechol 2,3-dioxygenase-like lactoylglutathione lyase family enzyme